MAEMKYSSIRLTPRIIRICDQTDVCEYLIVGEREAALIDTGYGIGNLKQYVDSLTDLPYAVYLSHGHVDHAGGAGQFDRVYLNPADTQLFQIHTAVLFRMAKLKKNAHLDIREEQLIPQRTAPFECLTDGMTVDLGNATLQFISVPGHTQGMMVPILLEDKVAFFGDACGVGTLLIGDEASLIADYRQSLRKLQTYEPFYDRVLRQHGSCTSTPKVLEDNIENCEKIMNGTDAHIPDPGLAYGKQCYWACARDPITGLRKDGREGNIHYSMDHVHR